MIDNRDGILGGKSGILFSVDLSDWVSSFLEKPVEHSFLVSLSSVVDLLSVVEEKESGVSSDTKVGSRLSVFSSINLGNSESGSLFFESISDFLVDWGKFLAMAAPWGIEFNEDVGELFGDLGEVFVSEDQDIAFFGPSEGAEDEGGEEENLIHFSN